MNLTHKKAFELVYKLDPQREKILTPLPNSFTPFWNHPFNVMKNVLLLGESNKDILTATILHDILEDTDYTEEEIKENFGEFIAEVVKALSKKKGYTKEDSEEYYSGIYNHPDLEVRKAACIIKLADRLDNMISLAITVDKGDEDRYLKETEKYFEKIAKVVNKEEVFHNLMAMSKNVISDK